LHRLPTRAVKYKSIKRTYALNPDHIAIKFTTIKGKYYNKCLNTS